MTYELEEHLEKHGSTHAPDIAYTLRVGRKSFKHRRMITYSQDFTKSSRNRCLDFDINQSKPEVIFIFTHSTGTQSIDIYASEPLFKKHADMALGALETMGVDTAPIRARIEGGGAGAHTREQHPHDALLTQFITQYGLAKLLIAWGVKPQALIAQGAGLYAAACMAETTALGATLASILEAQTEEPPRAWKKPTPNLWQHIPATSLVSTEDDLANLRVSHAVVIGPPLSLESLETAGVGMLPDSSCIALEPSAGDATTWSETITAAVGQLWLHGVEVNWDSFDEYEQRGRVALPTYPFDEQRHWVTTKR